MHELTEFLWIEKKALQCINFYDRIRYYFQNLSTERFHLQIAKIPYFTNIFICISHIIFNGHIRINLN